MINWRKVKTTLEWARLGKFLLDVFAAIFSVRLVKKLFTYVPQVSEDWATIIAWGAAAGVLAFLLWWQEKRKDVGQGQALQDPSTSLLNSSIFNAASYFQNAFVSAMQQEIETNARTAAEVNNPKDHEQFYVRLIATGLPAFIYELVWAYIFKSQILALMEVNRRLVPIPEVKEFYNKAAVEYPERYADYSFEQWMEFLNTNLLLIWHPSGMVEITVRGRDCLKYLTHNARYADQRIF